MHTRRSKLTEDAAKSDGTPESNTDDGKAMNVDAIGEESTSDAVEDSTQNHSSLETPEATVSEEASSKNDSSSHHLNVDSASIIATDTVSKIDEEISQTVEGASDSPSLTTSTVEGDASKMEHTLDESVAKPVVCSSEKSVAAEEMTADVLSTENDSSSATVTNAVTESPKSSVQVEGGPTTEGDTTNMEGTPEKSIDSGKVDEACVEAKSKVVPKAFGKKTDKSTPEEKRAKRKYYFINKAKFKLIGKKFCRERNIPFPDEDTFKNIIFDLYKNQKLAEKNLKIKLKDAAQRGQSALSVGAKKTKPRLDAKTEILPSVGKKISEMTTAERAAFFKLRTLKAAMKPIAIKHCHRIRAPFPTIKRYNAICKDLFEVGMLDEKNIKLEIETDFKERCNLPLSDEQMSFVLKRYCADKGLVDKGLKRMKAEILPKMPKKLLCQKHYWNVMYKEQKTNLFLEERNFEAAKKITLSSSKERSRMTENSRDRYDRGPWNASSSGATRNARSSRYTNAFSPRLDEDPIQQLIQTQQWIAEKAQMLGGLDSQKSAVTQSLPSHKELRRPRSRVRRRKKNRGSRGNGMNLQAQHDYSPPQPRGQGAMNVPNLFPSAPISRHAHSYLPERNFSGQNLTMANFISPTNISRAYGGQSSSSAQPPWPNESRMENRGRNSAGMPKDDYSRNSGFAENYRHQGTGFGSRSQGRDYEHLVEGTSERGCLESDWFSLPRQNKTNWDRNDLRRGNNERTQQRNSQEQSYRYKDGDWRYARGAPPRKKTRFDEDRQPQPSQSADLRCVLNELKSRFAEDDRMSPEPLMNPSTSSRDRMPSEPLMNPSTSSRKSWSQARAPRIGDQSKLLENPPFEERGKTCKVAIVHEDYPRRGVTDQEAGLIRTALLQRIGFQSGVRPRFSRTYQERGAVIFECEDQLTLSWVWENASTITPWTGSKLWPISWEKPQKEISIYVPKLLECLTAQALCERLMHQNLDLSTESWKLKSSDSSSSEGVIFVFYIDDKSMETLKSLDFRPYLGFSRVIVHVNQE